MADIFIFVPLGTVYFSTNINVRNGIGLTAQKNKFLKMSLIL